MPTKRPGPPRINKDGSLDRRHNHAPRKAYPPMHPDVFKLIVSRATEPRQFKGLSADAARLVLCEGMSTHRAAARMGCTQPPVVRMVRKIMQAWKRLGTCPYCGSRLPEV